MASKFACILLKLQNLEKLVFMPTCINGKIVVNEPKWKKKHEGTILVTEDELKPVSFIENGNIY